MVKNFLPKAHYLNKRLCPPPPPPATIVKHCNFSPRNATSVLQVLDKGVVKASKSKPCCTVDANRRVIQAINYGALGNFK
jgi:hypothetical protein